MRIGNFKTDHQVRDLIKNSHSGSVMISRSSMEKVEDGSKHDAVCEEPDKHQNPTNRHNSASVSNGKKSRIINQVQQTSNETLLINKQGMMNHDIKDNDPISPAHASAAKAMDVAMLR